MNVDFHLCEQLAYDNWSTLPTVCRQVFSLFRQLLDESMNFFLNHACKMPVNVAFPESMKVYCEVANNSMYNIII